MGRSLFRNVLSRVLRILIPAAPTRPAVWTQSNSQRLPGLRRLRTAFRSRDSQQVSVAALYDWRGNRVGEHALNALCDSGRIIASGKDRGLHGNFQLLHRDSRDHGVGWIWLGHGPSAEQ